MRRLRHLMRKELLELRQDVKLFGILFVAPLIQLTFLGYAATTDVKNVPMIVADADRSAASRELMERFEGSPYFTIVGVVTRWTRGSSAGRPGWRSAFPPAITSGLARQPRPSCR
jgi:hypothetical protein